MLGRTVIQSPQAPVKVPCHPLVLRFLRKLFCASLQLCNVVSCQLNLPLVQQFVDDSHLVGKVMT